jgi:hypothetical protein
VGWARVQHTRLRIICAGKTLTDNEIITMTNEEITEFTDIKNY